MTAAPAGIAPEAVPVWDPAAAARVLGIRPGDRVLEVGGAGNPFPRADVVCDLTFGSCAQRNGAPGIFRPDVTYVEAPAESLPFADREFDFVWCTQVLEHVRDPAAACRELSRVARRGFVEVPSRFGELLNGNPTHRWIVDREGDALVFHPRTFVEHPLRNLFYGVIFRDAAVRELSERPLRGLFNHQVLFDGGLQARVAPAAGPVFDYDDPAQAARAHYAFARNTLRDGAPPDYAYPDALEAARLRPEAPAARLLLAAFEARLGRPEAAAHVLDDVPGAEAEALRGQIDAALRGRTAGLATLPFPAAEMLPAPAAETLSTPAAEPLPGGSGPPPATRPLVTVLLAGGPDEALLAAAESALTQDYPDVEVIAAAADPPSPGWERLRMGERLRRVACGPDAGLGAAFNRAAMSSRGAVFAFALAGDRFLAHHVDRMVAELLVSGAEAVHGDRILLAAGGVAGPDIAPGGPLPAAASLSTLVARRGFLHAVGAFDEAAGDRAPSDYLRRVAATGKLVHVREATVEGRGPLGGVPAEARAAGDAALLDAAEGAKRLQPLELLRDLMAAFAREEGLRARIRALEALAGTPAAEPRP